MALVLLHRFDTSVEAAMARSRLRAEGIGAFLLDVENEWNTVDRVAIPVRLMVADEDFERANQILIGARRGDFRLEEDDRN